MIPVTCSFCQTRILVPLTVQGKEGVCFCCGHKLTVGRVDNPDAAGAAKLSADSVISSRYRILEELGRGGMGVVYRAEDILIGEHAALKFLHPGALHSASAQEKFYREAQVARRLRHDNIVAVHDVGRSEEGLPYICMELLEGESLRVMLRRHRENRRHIPVRAAVRITSAVLDALAHAHRTVVHRDLKPENIFLLPGEGVKVLDFGLAVVLTADDEGRRRRKQFAGTRDYSAPEQRLLEPVDGRADLYSTGLVLRELLTLRTPQEKPLDVLQCRADIPPRVAEVVRHAIQPEKNDRFSSAIAFREALLDAYEASYRLPPAATAEPGNIAFTASPEHMVLIEGGRVVTGSDEPDAGLPRAEQELPDYYIDRAPVTVREYARFLDETKRHPPRFWGKEEYSGADQPVIGVTWDDAMAYARWAGKALPAEAQWEFAAAGRERRRYPWGNEEPDAMRCNYKDYLGMPTIVEMHEEGATPEGLLDMAGNVYEWTADPFRLGDEDPRKAIRGGCWNSPARDLRCTARRGAFPDDAQPWLGFRCVLPKAR